MTTTQYSVQFNITQTATGNQDSGNVNLTVPAWTDAEAGAFVQAVQALPLPAGCTLQVFANKSVQATTIFATDIQTNPITFT